MSATPKRWILKPPMLASERAAFRDLNPVLAQVLFNRGIRSYGDAMAFLEGQGVLHSPWKMKGMQDAVARIRRAIRQKEHIVVYGDFDADGVTSTTLLIQTIEALGGRVSPYIPHRVDEGYGLNTPALVELARTGTKLVITVDCGVRSVDEVAAGNAAGLDIIVTDHHSIGEQLPPALAILNPKQADCSYPEDMLAGVGIAFKLADALLQAEAANGRHAPNITTEDLLDLVAIGTVADLAPLDRIENRTLVQQGLEVLNRAQRPGVYALLNVSHVEPGQVNAMAIGFGLGPRINAAGRLESAMTAYELLSSKSIGEAMRLAEMLQQLNITRQEMTVAAQDQARGLANATMQQVPPLVFAAHREFRSGIVGLVAGRLVEEFYRPAIVVELGDEESRGSCRSIPEVNITEMLDECAEMLVRHGGHAQAAGFTIKTENLPAFQARITELARQRLQLKTLEPAITIDAEMSAGHASLELANLMKKMEPTGHGNESPIFMTRRLKVQDYRLVGKEGNHLKLRLSDGPVQVDGIAFKQGEWAKNMPAYVDVAYYLEINEWNGNIKPQLNVQDIRPAGG